MCKAKSSYVLGLDAALAPMTRTLAHTQATSATSRMLNVRVYMSELVILYIPSPIWYINIRLRVGLHKVQIKQALQARDETEAGKRDSNV